MDEVGGGSKQDRINFFMERGRENVPAECIPHLYNAYCAARDVSYPVLFICAFLDEKKKICLHILNWKDSKTPCLVKVANENEKKIKEEIKRVRTTLETELKSNSGDEKIIQTGKSLFEKLVSKKQNGIIINELKKNKWGMWIYCDDVFDPIWEWLYVTSKTSSNSETPDVTIRKTRDKNSSRLSRFFKGGQNWNKLSKSNVEQPQKNSKEEGFFWGDKFSIVRLPKNGDFEIERSKSQIKSVAILLGTGVNYAISDMECLSNLCQHPIHISDYNLESLHNVRIGHQDYMHIAADIKIIKENYDDIIRAVAMAALSSKELIIFYNIWNVEEQHSMHNIQLEVVDSIPAKTWIYTSLDVSKEFATLFAKCFYDCFVKENDVAKALKKAREEIKNGYLFSTTNRELERDLKDRNIQEGSKEIFKQHIELSDDVFVENIAEENDIWILSDRKNERTYRIKKKDGKLTIYETDRNLGFNRFWGFAYVVNGNPFTAATWVRS